VAEEQIIPNNNGYIKPKWKGGSSLNSHFLPLNVPSKGRWVQLNFVNQSQKGVQPSTLKYKREMPKQR